MKVYLVFGHCPYTEASNFYEDVTHIFSTYESMCQYLNQWYDDTYKDEQQRKHFCEICSCSDWEAFKTTGIEEHATDCLYWEERELE